MDHRDFKVPRRVLFPLINVSFFSELPRLIIIDYVKLKWYNDSFLIEKNIMSCDKCNTHFLKVLSNI